ncbi:hypothetical protein APY03_7429 [Variovorax sp. WDL1]|nr:hypothetical protein APY03_7429 [Variovorax sp. WDL1]
MAWLPVAATRLSAQGSCIRPGARRVGRRRRERGGAGLQVDGALLESAFCPEGCLREMVVRVLRFARLQRLDPGRMVDGHGQSGGTGGRHGSGRSRSDREHG